MKFRPGTRDDADAIANLIASFQPQITDQPDGRGAEQYLASVSVEAERTYLASCRYVYIVAEDEGQLVGFIALRDVSHVFHMFVAKAHQRHGLAKRLWEQARSAALQHGAPEHFTVNSSLQAVPVYASFGFEAERDVVSVHGISFQPMRLQVCKRRPTPSFNRTHDGRPQTNEPAGPQRD